MARPTGSVALTLSLPVEVLMKSAPAIIATIEASVTLRSVARSPVPRMTLMMGLAAGGAHGDDLVIKLAAIWRRRPGRAE